MNSFFAMISRTKWIRRWALMRNMRAETVSEHTQDVAILAHALAVLTNRRFGGQIDAGYCVLLALYHDATEILTGDMPTPVKYFDPNLRHAYKQVECQAAGNLLTMLPSDLQEEYRLLLLPPTDSRQEEQRLVKAADKLSALIKCVEEEQQGNREFSYARQSTEQSLRAMKLPAVDCFLLEFLPAYAMTLDEQNQIRKD